MLRQEERSGDRAGGLWDLPEAPAPLRCHCLPDPHSIRPFSIAAKVKLKYKVVSSLPCLKPSVAPYCHQVGRANQTLNRLALACAQDPPGAAPHALPEGPHQTELSFLGTPAHSGLHSCCSLDPILPPPFSWLPPTYSSGLHLGSSSSWKLHLSPSTRPWRPV